MTVMTIENDLENICNISQQLREITACDDLVYIVNVATAAVHLIRAQAELMGVDCKNESKKAIIRENSRFWQESLAYWSYKFQAQQINENYKNQNS
jgi:predicted phosphohydrolase